MPYPPDATEGLMYGEAFQIQTRFTMIADQAFFVQKIRRACDSNHEKASEGGSILWSPDNFIVELSRVSRQVKRAHIYLGPRHVRPKPVPVGDL